jgi:hypothetical protein
MSAEEVLGRAMRTLTRVLEMFSRNVSKSFTNVGKIVSLHKADRLKEICVNRCQDTYFCVNQFWELFEASSSNIL